MDKVGREEGRNYRNALLETQHPSANVASWEGQLWPVGNPAMDRALRRSKGLAFHCAVKSFN